MDLIKRLDALGYIGATPQGITRVAGSAADEQAKLQVSEWMQDDGMEVRYDEHNNLIGRLPGLNPSLPPIVVGSHIDTVVNGGKYDGAYGIIAGLEAAKELQGVLRHPLEVVAFHDEEITMSGSRGYAADNPNISLLLNCTLSRDLFFSQNVKTWVLSPVLLDNAEYTLLCSVNPTTVELHL